MKKSNSYPDIVLPNGALVEFKMGEDETGMQVIKSLNIFFDPNKPIPTGGINALLLREIKIERLLKKVRNVQWNSDLADPKIVLKFIKNEFNSSRASYSDDFYAHLSFLYFYFMNESPNSPTAKLSEALDIPKKTVVNRLTKARAMGMISNSDFVYEQSPTGKSGGQLSPLAIKLIKNRKENT